MQSLDVSQGKGRKGERCELRRSIPCRHGFSRVLLSNFYEGSGTLPSLPVGEPRMETLAHRHLPMITLFFPVLSSHKSHFSNLFSFLFRIGIWMFSWAFASVRDFTPTKHFFFFGGISSKKKKKITVAVRLPCRRVASRRVSLACSSLSLSLPPRSESPFLPFSALCERTL